MSDSRLDVALAERGIARSRSQASELIASGRVRVNGATVMKAGSRVNAEAQLQVDGLDHYVSRAAHKLIAGLDAFGVDPSGLLALDVGASTGGFTQVLLERGAALVMAIDVGHGQLVNALRNDVRVRVVEGCNARELTPKRLSQETGVTSPPDLIVADISFISLKLVLPALLRVAAERTQFVLLIKPQFEVGRGGISGGIVTRPEAAAAAVYEVVRAAADLGLACCGLLASPITGEHGNREVLAHFLRADPGDPTEWKHKASDIFESAGDA